MSAKISICSRSDVRQETLRWNPIPEFAGLRHLCHMLHFDEFAV